jgi:hypothetical protein
MAEKACRTQPEVKNVLGDDWESHTGEGVPSTHHPTVSLRAVSIPSVAGGISGTPTHGSRKVRQLPAPDANLPISWTL